jgi:hypothetical protein
MSEPGSEDALVEAELFHKGGGIDEMSRKRQKRACGMRWG